jgi:hypothetical protein
MLRPPVNIPIRQIYAQGVSMKEIAAASMVYHVICCEPKMTRKRTKYFLSYERFLV